MLFIQTIDPSVMKVGPTTNDIGSRYGIRSLGDGKTAKGPGNGVQGAERTYFRRVAYGPRSSQKDPNAHVANMQRDGVGLLSSDA